MSFDAFIDEVTSDGRIIGWACRHDHVERLHIGIFYNAALVAEAIAQEYRADLLAAGRGLGHCAFNARLRDDPGPGERAFDVALLEHGLAMRRFVVTVPPPAPRESAAPRAAPATWSDEEVFEHLSRFDLAAQYAALGPELFAEATFQFVLRRWPEPEMIEAVRRAHAARVFDADAFVRELLGSEERRRKNEDPLPGPFDYAFPFRYPVASRRVVND